MSVQLGNEPLLTKPEERALYDLMVAGREAAERIANGETGNHLDRAVAAGYRARDRFTRANLRLVASIANRYPVPDGLERDDLKQIGMLGLVHAVDKFDGRKGFKFSTYATNWIKQAIERRMLTCGPAVTLPPGVGWRLAAYFRSRPDVPTDDPVLVAALRAKFPHRLDGWTRTDDEDQHQAHADQAASNPEEEAERSEEVRYVHSLLNALSPEQAAVLRLRFGIGTDQPASRRVTATLLGIKECGVITAEREGLAILRETAA